MYDYVEKKLGRLWERERYVGECFKCCRGVPASHAFNS